MKLTNPLLYPLLFFTNFCFSQNVFFQHYTTDDGLPHNVIHCLLQDEKGLLWIGTEDGLTRFDGFQFQSNLLENEATNSKVNTIAIDKKGIVWVAFENGRYQGFENGNRVEKAIKISTINEFFSTQNKNKKVDNLLINNNLYQTLNLQSTPTFSLKDKENNTWLATDGGGLYCIYDAPFTNFSIENGLKNTFVNDISENQKGEIIAGTKAGLFKLKNQKWQEEFFDFPYSADKIEIWQFKRTTDKAIIFSSNVGIIQYDTEKTLCIPDQKTIKTFILDKYNRINLFHRKFFHIYADCEAMPIRWPINDETIEAGYCLFEDKSGNLYMGTEQGVIRFKQGLSQRFTIKDGLPNNHINDIKQDSIGNIWFATERGLSKLDTNGKFANFTQEDGLLSNTCRKISIDARGGIWIASPQGLHYFDEQNMIPYNARTGLVSADINCLFVDSKKRLWIGTSQGISMLNIEKLPQKVAPPKVIIEAIELNETSVTTVNLQNLNFKSRLRFDYTAIAFIDARKVLFQYRIAENADWQTTSNRSVLFSNLQDGNYNFQLRAKKINSDWSKFITIPFTIYPPWWRTNVAIFLYVLFLIVLIIGLMQYFRLREKRKMKLNQQFAALELSALQAQMNPHFIFNALNAIQNFVLKNDAITANGYLSKFAKLMRLFLESSKSKYIEIEDEINLLKLYVDLEHLCYPNKFDYEFEIAAAVIEEDYEIPTMIIQPYIENAINHGLVQKKSKGLLKINFQLIDSQIIVTISDNGIGRKKAQENRLKTHRSHGMSLTNDRLKVLNYIENSNIQVEISDLGIDKVETGTVVEIRFPVE